MSNQRAGVPWISASSAAALAFAAWPLVAGPAEATPASGFTAVQQYKGDYSAIDISTDMPAHHGKPPQEWDLKLKTKGGTDLWVVRNSIAAGGQSGWHTHPGPSLITVTVGEVTVYDGDDPVCGHHVVRAGQGLIDVGGGDVHLIRNESGAAAETVAVQFLPDGAVRRVDADKPTNCPSF